MKILFLILAYLIGSIPAGYILFRFKEKSDIRKYGSFNIGATNILRVSGWKTAVPVLLFDVAKGLFPVFAAGRLFDDPRIQILVGFLAILGHCFPLYIRFKGGKGIATTMGVYLALALEPVLCIIGIFILIVALTRYISLASVTAALSFPFFILIFKEPNIIAILGFFVFLLVIYTHRTNIKSLLRGAERKL